MPSKYILNITALDKFKKPVRRFLIEYVREFFSSSTHMSVTELEKLPSTTTLIHYGILVDYNNLIRNQKLDTVLDV